MLPLLIYILFKCLFLFSGKSFRLIHPSFIRRRGVIYQFAIFSKLFLNIIYLFCSKPWFQIEPVTTSYSPVPKTVWNISSNTTWYWGEIYPVVKFCMFATKEEFLSEKSKIFPSHEWLFHLGILFNSCSI